MNAKQRENLLIASRSLGLGGDWRHSEKELEDCIKSSKPLPDAITPIRRAIARFVFDNWKYEKYLWDCEAGRDPHACFNCSDGMVLICYLNQRNRDHLKNYGGKEMSFDKSKISITSISQLMIAGEFGKIREFLSSLPKSDLEDLKNLSEGILIRVYLLFKFPDLANGMVQKLTNLSMQFKEKVYDPKLFQETVELISSYKKKGKAPGEPPVAPPELVEKGEVVDSGLKFTPVTDLKAIPEETVEESEKAEFPEAELEEMKSGKIVNPEGMIEPVKESKTETGINIDSGFISRAKIEFIPESNSIPADFGSIGEDIQKIIELLEKQGISPEFCDAVISRLNSIEQKMEQLKDGVILTVALCLLKDYKGDPNSLLDKAYQLAEKLKK
uniref:Uncharacterized protein n=1 Tax=Dictyoglomus turgidum TaxID=513050 RepID=A0A7C3WXL6_9BACT